MSDTSQNIDLIFTVTHLVQMFEESGGLSGFLHRVVEAVAEHMNASVASIYLLDDDNNELVLRATVGLASDSVGNVRLAEGEGITGQALEELRPIREARGQDNPAFRFFPDIREEEYDAFLAVPIVHGLRKVGVLTVQHQETGFFDETDTKTLTTIASHLASAIENSELLGKLDDLQPEVYEEDQTDELPHFVQGTGVSSGFALGEATVTESGSSDYLRDIAARANDMNLEAEDFESALDRTEEQIRALEEKLVEEFGDPSAAQIFTAHRFMLRDEHLADGIRNLIEEGYTPANALLKIIEGYVDKLSTSSNPVLRERTQDLRDLGYRLLVNMTGLGEGTKDYDGRIIISPDLMPSDIFKLAAQGASGIVLLKGSTTSHISILGRSLGLPIVIADNKNLLNLSSDTQVLVDGSQGNVFVSPTDEVRNRYRELRIAQSEAKKTGQDICPVTQTNDGKRIRLMANINLCSDLPAAKRLCAEGIGLYRSEFPFIIRNEFPSEDDQYHVYRRILKEMEGQPVIFRTLDVGGDKMLSYAPDSEASNPFMGMRSIRFSLRNRQIFSHQIRAMLRAAYDRPLKIMFPLIGSLDDFSESRAFVQECQARLDEEDIPYCDTELDIGITIELPSAVELIDELASEADFLSIGTNDLVQYLLAVDRTNPEMQELYRSHHPAVLRLLKRIADAAQKHNTPLSVCGESASDTSMLPFFIGIGIREFSLDPRNILRVQSFIETLDSKEACQLSRRLLAAGTVDQVERIMETP